MSMERVTGVLSLTFICSCSQRRHTVKYLSYAFAAGLAVASFANPAAAAEITGAGATFPFPVYSKWAEAYKKETGNGLNYQSIGSGGGISQVKAGTVDFGATDQPLSSDELAKLAAALQKVGVPVTGA